MDRLRRMASPLVLSASFAVFVQMAVVLSGRAPAAALGAALAAGAAVVALAAAPGPLAALRSLTRSAVLQACAGGLVAVAGAPAHIAELRMTDAPAGSLVVFWVAGGWAAVAACGAAVLALRQRRVLGAGWAVSGGLLALAGAAGVVANWERPSSFSPLVRFAPQELGMLLGGVLLLLGGLLIVRAAGTARLDGALLWAAGSALAASLVWWGASGFGKGWSALAEQPVAFALAALAWGLVCSSWPATLKAWGPATGAAALAATPVLLSALILLEQAVGVAGPQPLILPGVAAGSLLIIAAVAALARVRAARGAAAPRLLVAAAALPALLAAVALSLPAILVRVDVAVEGGMFAGSWTMSGAESVAGWAAVALAVLVIVVAADAGPVWPAVAALAASAAWPWLLGVPTHVWSRSLAPEIQVYYGTEYGTIAFTGLPNVPMAAAVILGAAILVIIVVRRVPTRRGVSHPEDGGK
jgi:hypothetical protein